MTASLTADLNRRQTVLGLSRLVLVVTLIVVEVVYFFYLKLLDDVYVNSSGLRYTEYLRDHGGVRFTIAAYSAKFIGYVFFAYLFSMCVFLVKDAQKNQLTAMVRDYKVSSIALAVNLLSFLVLVGLFQVFTNLELIIEDPGSTRAILYAFSPIVWCAFGGSVLALIIPPRKILRWAKQNPYPLVCISAGMVLLWNRDAIDVLMPQWSRILLEPTLALSTIILQLFGVQAISFRDAPDDSPSLATSSFSVGIGDACSGYEGMSISILALSVYCVSQRHNLYLMRSLLSLPLAATAMFLLNSVRIATLVAIGHYWSPAVALGGFHSVGGWLNLIVVLTAMGWILNHTPFFTKSSQRTYRVHAGNTIYLIPLVIFIGVSLLAKSVTAEFSWAYPIPVLITLGALYQMRGQLLALITRPSLQSIALGVAAFFIWIYMIPDEPDKSALFYEELSSVSIGLGIGWLLFRIVGAVVVVPIAEELCFRGFFQPALAGWLGSRVSMSFAVNLSLVATALLFGVMHSNIAAATAAGLLYGVAYRSRDQISDPICAHAVTNLLLAFYVIQTGYGSYW